MTRGKQRDQCGRGWLSGDGLLTGTGSGMGTIYTTLARRVLAHAAKAANGRLREAESRIAELESRLAEEREAHRDALRSRDADLRRLQSDLNAEAKRLADGRVEAAHVELALERESRHVAERAREELVAKNARNHDRTHGWLMTRFGLSGSESLDLLMEIYSGQPTTIVGTGSARYASSDDAVRAIERKRASRTRLNRLRKEWADAAEA